MPEQREANGLVENGGEFVTLENPSPTDRHWLWEILPAIGSSIVIGSGQILQRRGEWGLIFAGGYLLIVTLFAARQGAQWPVAVWLAWFVLLMGNLAAGLDALFRPKRLSSGLKAALTPVIIGLAFVSSGAATSLSLMASGFRTFQVPSTAMESTILHDEVIMVDMEYYQKRTPHRGDVVVFLNQEELFIVKRVVALGGDSIEAVDNVFRLNGEELDEPYARYEGRASLTSANFSVEQVPPRHLFMLGDNRDVSLDSRHESHGTVPVDQVQGRVLYILRSPIPERFGRKVE